MKQFSFLPAVVFCFGLGLGITAPSGAGTDSAAALAEQVAASMGGTEALARVRILKFDFVVVRDGKEAARYRHVWDRASGDYRVDGKDREGKMRSSLFNVATRQGRSWSDGTELAGAELAAALERAYGRFINDTYWLLMPWKLRDPGVRLETAEDGRIGTRVFRRLRLSFDAGTGLTPGDVYWIYVDPDTHRVVRWDMLLTGETGDPEAVDWGKWTRVGAIWLSLEKTKPDGGFAIRFENVEALENAAPALFFAAPR